MSRPIHSGKETEAVPDSPPKTEPERQNYFIARAREKVREREARLGRPLRANITVFGCQMNEKDGEKLRGIMREIGYELTDAQEADFVLFNTCTVRENANQRVYGRLGQLKSQKKKNPELIIALCGCMMQDPLAREKILQSYRFVDILFGTYNIFRLAELLDRRLSGEKPVVDVWEKSGPIVEDLPSQRKYPFKCGVNIMFGCDNFCTYCIVPAVRGRERSRSPEEILAEVRRLAADGVREVMLLGQNVNSYGKGLAKPLSFAELLRQVEEVEGIERIRFMTSHPKDLSDELIEVMRDSRKICRHLHLPLQSGSSRLLRKMNRRYDKEGYLHLVDRIREQIPDIALTTDIIVGFPGETEEDFEETLDVVRTVRYESAFTFLYSPRSGTPAASMPDPVPSDLAHERLKRLLREVQSIAAEVCEKDVGCVQDALVEECDGKNPGYVTGRLGNNLMVHFPGSPELIGQIVPVRLDESRGFYYMGTRID